jgi:tRNA dimethylallyltransferase
LSTLRALNIPFVKIVLDAELSTLVPRIAERTARMLRDGLIAEAERIGIAACAADAVGYREALAYQHGWLTASELETVLVRATRRYAKRQLTWFRAEPHVTWLRAGDVVAADAAVVALGWTPVATVRTGEE